MGGGGMENVQDLYMLPNTDFFVKCIEAGSNIIISLSIPVTGSNTISPIKDEKEKQAFHFSTYDEHLP